VLGVQVAECHLGLNFTAAEAGQMTVLYESSPLGISSLSIVSCKVVQTHP